MPLHPIIIARGQLHSIASHMLGIVEAKNVVVITDGNLISKTPHVATLKDSFIAENVPVSLFTISACEASKSQSVVDRVMDFLFNGCRFDRRTPIIALGGGVVGDVAGFVASTALRGVPFVQIPTTLLAMVDASIGGKNGINTERGKNLIGTFHLPSAVFIDPDVLVTLADEEFINGFAECIKMGMIADTDLFYKIEDAAEAYLKRDPHMLTNLIRMTSKLKLMIVENDPRDKRDRAMLNFGHSVGHALETCSWGNIPHGRAVAWGMVAEAHMAVSRGIMVQEDLSRLEALLNRFGFESLGLRVNSDTLPDQRLQIRETMNIDKKVVNGNIQFALPTGVGYGKLSDVNDDAILAALEYIQR